MTYRQAMHRAAKAYFTAVLRECGGDVDRAAAHAGVSSTTVHTFMRRTELKAIRLGCSTGQSANPSVIAD